MSSHVARKCERCGRETSRINILGGVLLCDSCYEKAGREGGAACLH